MQKVPRAINGVVIKTSTVTTTFKLDKLLTHSGLSTNSRQLFGPSSFIFYDREYCLFLLETREVGVSGAMKIQRRARTHHESRWMAHDEVITTLILV